MPPNFPLPRSLRTKTLQYINTLSTSKLQDRITHHIVSKVVSPLLRRRESVSTYEKIVIHPLLNLPTPRPSLEVGIITTGRTYLGLPFTVKSYHVGNTLIDCNNDPFFEFVNRYVESTRSVRFDEMNLSVESKVVGSVKMNEGGGGDGDIIRLLPITQLILTHHHEDHTGNLGNFLEEYTTGTSTSNLPFKAYASPSTCEIMQPRDGITYGADGRSYALHFYEHMFYGRASVVPKFVRGGSESNVIPLKYSVVNGNHIYDEINLLTSNENSSNNNSNLIVKPIHIPGHARDMIGLSLLPSDYGVFLSADGYITGRPFYLRADEDFHTNLKSMDDIRDEFMGSDGKSKLDVILCGHFPVFENGWKLLNSKIVHLKYLKREAYRLKLEGYSDISIARELFEKTKYINFFFAFFGGDVSSVNFVRNILYGSVERVVIRRGCDEVNEKGAFAGDVIDWHEGWKEEEEEEARIENKAK